MPRNLLYILPWPILYETLNTRLVRRPDLVKQFVAGFLKRPNAKIWDDHPYRDAALKKTLDREVGKRHPLSLGACRLTLKLCGFVPQSARREHFGAAYGLLGV